MYIVYDKIEQEESVRRKRTSSNGAACREQHGHFSFTRPSINVGHLFGLVRAHRKQNIFHRKHITCEKLARNDTDVKCVSIRSVLYRWFQRVVKLPKTLEKP